jgi:predicted nucleotidyltransferase
LPQSLLPPERWPALPAPLRDFLIAAVERCRRTPSLAGLAAGGSFACGGLDDYSDLDLLVLVDPAAWPAEALLDLTERHALAEALGPLLAGFTGEHVGEPRLLICLYGPPVLHVDLKFIRPDDLLSRIEDPVVLWERDGSVTAALARGQAAFPVPDRQWLEDRFWVWIHYGAAKLGRGELFEALDMLAFLRVRVLGPLALEAAGARPTGVRRLESAAPDAAVRLREVVAAHDPADCARALRAAVSLYRAHLAESSETALIRRRAAEAAAIEYLAEVEARLARGAEPVPTRSGRKP